MENGQDEEVYDAGAGEHLGVAMEEEEVAGARHKKVRTTFDQVAVPMKEAVKMVDRSLPTISFAHRSLLWLSLILFLVSLCSDVPAQLHDLHIASLGQVDSFRGEVTVLWYSLTRSF
jgi:hypothetical protein